ncbi:hypothetical protein M6B38_314915 [Iris pallida]|uniref:Uncharacterized protein n=1 Tax=Iris pallida TaxID=29817 RepID=A0AAX6HFN3_IRIPA|nr:hypothetical protein M6B38_314915 [Iris pallida]
MTKIGGSTRSTPVSSSNSGFERSGSDALARQICRRGRRDLVMARHGEVWSRSYSDGGGLPRRRRRISGEWWVDYLCDEWRWGWWFVMDQRVGNEKHKERERNTGQIFGGTLRTMVRS